MVDSKQAINMNKEYYLENNQKVNPEDLKAGFIPTEDFIKSHKSLIIPCHDIFIEYDSGVLLVKRDNFPAKDILWPIGGRILRGLPILDSLKKKVKDECNLEIDNIEELGWGRTCFQTDAFNHGRGTDTINIIFKAKGKGKIKLNNLHSEPTIIKEDEYSKIREELHPYVRDNMDLIFKK